MSATSPQIRAGVVDASILVKVFLPEDGADVATALIQRSREESAVRAVPDLAYVECTNIFWRWVHRGMLSADLARQSVSDLRHLPLQVWPSVDLIDSALDIALTRDVTVYDATYVALARVLDIPFITADEALVRKLGGSGDNLRLLDSFHLP